MTIEENILRILHNAEAKIRANMDAKNINASHRTERSLRVEQSDSHIQLVIGGDKTAPAETLEIGRPGGNVPRGFYHIIKQWTYDKGLSFTSERERSTFAYFTANKIAAKGTLRHKHHEDVYSTIVNDAVRELENMIGLSVSGSIDNKIKTNF